VVTNPNFEAVTAFEIFEHLICPFNALRSIKAKKLISSLPLKLWFAQAYWGENECDRHYHEFEVKQFNMLLNKSGWEIKKSEKWISSDKIWGIRPILRFFTPRYYIVYCERN
ncbi:MAG: methyltransferase, partial [Marinilabiliales bacterium]